MENRIKEQHLDFFADRTSCHAWWPNQFRLLLSSCAYVLVTALQRLGLGGTALATAYVGTLRLKLFKIGAIVRRNTRRIRLLFASHYPYQDLFLTRIARLCPGSGGRSAVPGTLTNNGGRGSCARNPSDPGFQEHGRSNPSLLAMDYPYFFSDLHRALRSCNIQARVTLQGIELMHMIKKGQMVIAGGQKLSAAGQFYSL